MAALLNFGLKWAKKSHCCKIMRLWPTNCSKSLCAAYIKWSIGRRFFIDTNIVHGLEHLNTLSVYCRLFLSNLPASVCVFVLYTLKIINFGENINFAIFLLCCNARVKQSKAERNICKIHTYFMHSRYRCISRLTEKQKTCHSYGFRYFDQSTLGFKRKTKRQWKQRQQQ